MTLMVAVDTAVLQTTIDLTLLNCEGGYGGQQGGGYGGGAGGYGGGGYGGASNNGGGYPKSDNKPTLGSGNFT